jgi:hypothetical protein
LLILYFQKGVLKDSPPEGIDILQLMGINQYRFGAVQILLYGIRQLKGRTAVEIAHQTNVQIINASLLIDF